MDAAAFHPATVAAPPHRPCSHLMITGIVQPAGAVAASLRRVHGDEQSLPDRHRSTSACHPRITHRPPATSALGRPPRPARGEPDWVVRQLYLTGPLCCLIWDPRQGP